ncbi:hypothetical protein HWV23_10610 [Natronomonas halophila]|uniref:hypothetical protein n=1 Tax=Natronomonas halophila TaxID=2747817 RepID=UPI0015B391CF|nr:hypothetical protein [Natronomonas halophila]QLD86156.1 hypothetical protein HWV23_10610 [Natronomonas halophila]
MVGTTTQTVTVGQTDNSGNLIADQTHAGKTIHVPAGEIGATYEVRLIDRGDYLVADVVDRTKEVQPRQPSIDNGPDTDDVGKDLLDPSRNSSYSHEVRNSPASGKLRSTPEKEEERARRSQMTQRKL